MVDKVGIILSDKYMVENGYFTTSVEDRSAYVYTVYTPTEKFRKLFDTCILIAKKNNSIITEELLIKTMQGETKRIKKVREYYQKVKRPEGYMTIKERHAFKLKEREALGLKKCKPNMKYDNRQFK